MSDWKSKRLDRIDSDGLSSVSKPYRDGDYWCVTVRVSYEHTYSYDSQSSSAISSAMGFNSNTDALKRESDDIVLLHPGKRGANNAVLEGLQALGRGFLCGNDWHTFYERPEISGFIMSVDAATSAGPDTDALLENHLLFKGPVVDTRPFGSFARYQVGVHYAIIEGWNDVVVAENPNISAASTTVPPLSHMQDTGLLEIATKTEVDDWPKSWQLDTEAMHNISKYVLGSSWDPDMTSVAPFKPREYKYNSYQEFEREVETLAIHLTVRQQEHEKLENQRLYFKNTDVILNFNNYADVLRDCARQIKSFLLFNGLSLTQDEVAFGWYPALPDAALTTKYNPDQTAFNFLEAQGATHIAKTNAKLYSSPNPPEAPNGAGWSQDYFVGDITDGAPVRQIEKVAAPKDGGNWIRVRVISDISPDQDGPPSPLAGITGWIHDTRLKTYVPPTTTEGAKNVQEIQTLLETSGYLAYIRCGRKSVLDTETDLQQSLNQATKPPMSFPPASTTLQPINKIKRRKVGGGKESDTGFRKRLNFHWIGFSAFLETPGFANRTIAQFFKSMNSINNRPGNDYDSMKFQACRGTPKPGSSGAERLPLIGNKSKNKLGFVDTYVLEEVERRPYSPPQTASELTKYFDSFRNEFNFAETKSDVDFVKEATVGKTMRYAVANRNRTLTNQAGDALFAAMPANVDKVRSWDDLYAFVLNRVDIPTIFYKLMDCLGANVSLDDLIEYLCDAFLRRIGTSPEEVDRFFEFLEGKIVDYSTFETGLGDRYNIELVDPYQLMQDIKTGMAEYAAQNMPLPDSPGETEVAGRVVDDEAFYRATIAAIGDNPNNRMFLCELIMAGMFSLGALLYQALMSEKDIDPLEANSLAKKLKEEGSSIGKGCALPWLNMPNAISVVDKWLASILKQLEEKLYQYVQEKVFEPVNEALLKLVDCGEDDENYGLIPLDDLLPAGPEDPALGQKMGPLGIDDPRNFLSALVAILTPLEICALLDGAPKTDTLIAVKGFMKANYPESYNMLDSDIKIITFFQDLRNFFDTSVCLRDTYPPNDALQDFCQDGETNRHAAIRASLAQKGLTDEEIDAQIEIDKELTKEQISNIVQMATLGQGKEEPFAPKSTESKSFINDIIATSESTMRQSKYAIDTMLEPINNAFVIDIGSFIPSIFSEIIKLRGLGLNIERLPFYDLLRGAYNPAYESTYFNTHAGLNRMIMWAPRIEFVPGIRDLNPQSENFMKYIEGSAELIMRGTKYQLANSKPGHANITYEIYPFNAVFPKPKDNFGVRIKGRKAGNTNSGYVSADVANFSLISDLPDLGEFANIFLQNETAIGLFRNNLLPYQVSVFKTILAWALTRAGTATLPSGAPLPSYSRIYGGAKNLIDASSGNIALANEHEFTQKNNYFKVIDDKIQYDNFKFGVDNNVDLVSVIYDIIVESYNKKIAEITSNSDLFDLQRLSEVNIYDSEDAAGLLGVKKLAQDAANRAQQLMRRIDLEGGEAPTHISDAMFEGLVQALVRLYVVEMVMSCLFMFSRFRPEDVFSENIISEFIIQKLKKTTFPDGSTLKEKYIQFLYSQELKLRKFMSERDGLVAPSEDEIDARVKKEVYKDKTSPDQTFNELVNNAMPAGSGQNEVAQVIEEVLGLTIDPLEQEVLDFEAAGAPDDQSGFEIEYVVYPTPTIDQIIVENSEVDWNGLEDPYRWAHKIWIYKGAFKSTLAKEYISETDIEEKKKILNDALNEKIAFADADEEGAATAGQWSPFEKIMPDTATTTCLRELIRPANDSGQLALYAHPAEVPNGVDLAKGGTTWDAGELLTYPVDPPIIRNVGVISSLEDGWDIDISFDFTKMKETTSASDDLIDQFQQKILTQYGLHGVDIDNTELASLTPTQAKFNSGFLEAAMNFSYPPNQGGYLAGKGYIDQETLTEHNYDPYQGAKFKRKASFRVRSGPAITNPHDSNVSKAYSSKLSAFYKPNNIKIKQSAEEHWYPSPPGVAQTSPSETLEIHNLPLIGKVGFTEQTWVSVHNNTPSNVGVKYSGLNRFRVVKRILKVPVKIIVEEYTGQSAFNSNPAKGKVPQFRYEYQFRAVNVLQEVVTEHSVVQPKAGWKATEIGGSSINDGETANLVAGYAGPQQKEVWQTRNAYGILNTNDFAQYPIIQIRPPVYWFNEDTHLGNPLHGDDTTFIETQAHEIFVPDVKDFRLNIKGTGYTSKTKAYLQPVHGKGATYPFDVEIIDDKQLKLRMPLEVYLGDRMFDNSTPDWWVPGWQNSKGSGEYEDQTGDVLKMAGIPVVDQDIYVLVLDNNGQRQVGNVYFTTHNYHKVVWNDSFYLPDPLRDNWVTSKPELPDIPVVFEDDIDPSAPTTAFNMPVYPIQTDKGTYAPETWDVHDVATIIGNHRLYHTSRYSKDTNNEYSIAKNLFLCEPRIDKKKYKAGGFILEKYVRIKFKSKQDLTAPSKAHLDAFAEFLYESAEKNYVEVGANDIEDTSSADLKKIRMSDAQIGSLSLINGLSVQDGKSHDIVMSYASFIDMLKSVTDGKSAEPKTIGYAYTVTEGKNNPVASFFNSYAEDDYSPRICINNSDARWYEKFQSTHGYEDIIGPKVWESVDDFIQFDSKAYPYSTYDVQSFTDIVKVNVGFYNSLFDVKVEGYEIIRTDPFVDPDSTIDDDLKAAAAISPWTDILEDVAFGLRLSYVLPEAKGSKNYPNHYATAFEPRYHYLDLDNDRQSIDDQVKNRLNPWYWNTSTVTYDALAEFSSDKTQLRQYLKGTDKEIFVLSKPGRDHLRRSMHCFKTNELKEVRTDEEGQDVSESVHLFPIVSAEIGPSSIHWPNELKSGPLIFLEKGYPEAKPADGSYMRKKMYKELYKKLRTDSKFKLLFEYIIPSKRILGLNAIYNMMNFDQFFVDECVFPSIFNSTRTLIKSSIELTQEYPAGGKVDGDDVPVFPDMQKKLKEMTKAVASGEACPPNIKALADHINKDKLI